MAERTVSSSKSPVHRLRHLSERAKFLDRAAKFIGALAQFVKQSGIFDGDHGLAGEVLKQSNLLVVEWADFPPHEYNKADYFAFLEHWHCQDSAIAAKLDGRHRQRIALKVRSLDCDVGGLRNRLCSYRAAKCVIRTGPQRLTLHEFRKRLRRVVCFLLIKRISPRIFDLNDFTAHGGTADDRPRPRGDRRSALVL